MKFERIDEVVATGFSIYFWKHHGMDIRRFRPGPNLIPSNWGWSWEAALYLYSKRWMITLG